jgi:chromosome segregation ATPase
MTTQSRTGLSVRLEVRLGSSPASTFEVGDGGFLIGSVPGCDLRLPGTGLPPVICLIHKQIGGASFRKLAPVLPITLNGRPASSSFLADGDRLAMAGVEVTVQLAGGPALAEDGHASQGMARQQLAEALRSEQARWAGERQALQAELTRLQAVNEALQRPSERKDSHASAAARADLERREKALASARDELAQKLREAEERAGALARQDEELARARREMGKLRQQLVSRVQRFREKLVARQQGARRAARKLIARKQAIDAEEAALREAQARLASDQAESQARAEQLARERSLLDEQYALLTSRQQEHQRELAQRLAEIHERERKLTEEAALLDRGQKQYKDDLVRLDRFQASLDSRQKKLQQTALEVDHRFEQIQRDSRELEDQARLLDDWHARLASEAEALAAQKREQQESVAQAEQRAAALDSQQAMLATLRMRLERMREELREQEQALATQRDAVAECEKEARARLEEASRLRAEAANDKQLWQAERERFESRQQVLEDAAAHLRLAQESFAAEQAALEARQAELDAVAQEQAAQAEILLTRGRQVEELQARLTASTEAVQRRAEALTQAEAALQSLREQIHKRSEEQSQRLQEIDAVEAGLRQRAAALEDERCAVEASATQKRAEAEAFLAEAQAQTSALEKRQAELAESERRLGDMRRRLEEEAEAASDRRQALAAERLAWETEREKALEHDRLAREEVTTLKERAAAILQQLPDLEARAQVTLSRLASAREQLRDHLAEAHGYALQSREDLEAARRQLDADAERLRQQEREVRLARDEHRLAVASFRQQLAEWQGKVAEMRHALQLGTSQLDQRRAEVEQEAQQAAATQARLAAEAAALEAEKRQVAEKRGQMDRHLIDMREWYRKKLRDLAGVDLPPGDEPAEGDLVPLPSRLNLPASLPPREGSRAVLTLSEEVTPADRQLGEMLASLGLVDSDTLNVLWADARRQRRPLRQLMLANGFLTLYQMALIEAGNLDALVLGPVRVIDKLPSTPREAAYRVFDPRLNAEALLRHLAEPEMHDAVRPGEFRERFRAALAVRHPHVAAVLDVFDLQGRPAALCEWVNGLASGEWPGLAAAPGAWYRLVCQAALGLSAIHEQGLTHGHLSPSSFVLGPDGTLKLLGLGEPPWLASGEPDETPQGDLLALGRIATGWAAVPPGGRATRAKPLPEELQSVLARLTSGGFASAGDLLTALDQAGKNTPASAAAWDRLLKHASEASTPSLRRSA